MALTKVPYSMILGASVNVFDKGAIANGDGYGAGTDSSTAIQDAIDAVIATGQKGKVFIPAGTYRCDYGLTLDLSLVSIESDGATLDFTNLVPATGGAFAAGVAANWTGPIQGVALTVITSAGVGEYAGGAYYEFTNSIRGVRIKGKQGVSEGGTPPAPVNDTIGVYFYGPSPNTAIIGLIQSVVISQFYHGVVFGQNAWGGTFHHCQIGFTGNCVYMPQIDNAGEKNVFSSCVLFNSVNGLVLNNAYADTYITNTTVDGMDSNYALVTAGQVDFCGCHFEGNMTGRNLIWNDGSFPGTYATITMSACTIISKTGRGTSLFLFDGPTNFSWFSGIVDDTATGSTVELFGGTFPATVNIFGGYWSSNAVMFGFPGNPYTTVIGVTGLGYNGIFDSRQAVICDSVSSTNGVTAGSGVFFNNTKTITISTLLIPESFGLPSLTCGLLVLRDATSGGTALIQCDPSIGCVDVQNSITGLAVSYSVGDLVVTLSSGTVPRSIRWSFIRLS